MINNVTLKNIENYFDNYITNSYEIIVNCTDQEILNTLFKNEGNTMFKHLISYLENTKNSLSENIGNFNEAIQELLNTTNKSNMLINYIFKFIIGFSHYRSQIFIRENANKIINFIIKIQEYIEGKETAKSLNNVNNENRKPEMMHIVNSCVLYILIKEIVDKIKHINTQNNSNLLT